MKKISLLVFFLFSMFFVRNIYAFESFSKSGSNPLQFSNYYPETGRFQPHVIYDNGLYKMWYASYSGNRFRIAYAISVDGINWQGTTLIDPYPQIHNHDPFALKEDNNFTLFFAASPLSGAGIKVYKATLSNGNQIVADSIREIIRPTLPWEGNDVSSPAVIFKNGVYYLFYSASSGAWKIGLAISHDGVNWNKCPNPILKFNNVYEEADGPTLFEKDNQLFLFYHLPNRSGIKVTSTSSSLSCNSVWTQPQILLRNDKNYDQNYLTSPSVIEANNQIKLFYGGLSINNVWTINLATSGLEFIDKNPVVLIPGLFASWNKQAIVYGQSVSRNDWQMNPVVKEYDGIKNTFFNLGFEFDKDFYIFNYDWRKNIDSITEDLNYYLKEKVYSKHPGKNIVLIGHSLGGLVSRVYIQKYHDDRISKIITSGSPHLGTAQVYKAVEAGDFENGNNLMWLTQKLILQIYRDGVKNDRQIVQEKNPILKDLLPKYYFLKTTDNNSVHIENMKIKNDFLLTYNPNLSEVFPILYTIGSKKGNTLSGYKIKTRNLMDQLMDYYPDGHPTENTVENGDYLINHRSSLIGDNQKTINLDHGGIVAKKEAIKEILHLTNISYSDNQISEGTTTNLFPSLLFLIMSPVNLEVMHNGKTYLEKEGIAFIENAESGEYLLTAKGTAKGRYSILIGQITDNKDVWSRIEGEIKNDNPSSQIDRYYINFDSQNPNPYPIKIDKASIANLFDQLIIFLQETNEDVKSNDINSVIDNIRQSKNHYSSGNKGKVQSSLINVLNRILTTRNKLTDPKLRNKLLLSVEKLEYLYEKSLYGYSTNSTKTKLTNDLQIYKKVVASLPSYFLGKKQKGGNISDNVILLKEIENRLNVAEESLTNKKFILSDILIRTISGLVKEVRK
jgi:pimeloyl-ACP methyl ester carboxylesterase